MWRLFRRCFECPRATGDVARLVANVLRRRGAKRAPRGFVVKDTLLFEPSVLLPCLGGGGVDRPNRVPNALGVCGALLRLVL